MRISLVQKHHGRVNEIPVRLVPGDNLDEGSMMEVHSPDLSEGMQVVLEGVHLLRDGQTVNVVGQPQALSGSADSISDPPVTLTHETGPPSAVTEAN